MAPQTVEILYDYHYRMNARAPGTRAEESMRVPAKIGIVVVVLGAIGYVAVRSLSPPASSSARIENGPATGSPSAVPPLSTPAAHPAVEKNASALLPTGLAARSRSADYPFAAGEKLEFTAGWATLVAAGRGNLEVASAPPAGGSTFHFVATAETVPPASYLFLLQDRFDSYAEASSLASLRYEMHLREGKTERKNIVEFDQKRSEAKVAGGVVPVKTGSHDTVALIYAVRATDWEKKDAATFDFFDGQQSRQLRVRVVSRAEAVTVPAGKFAALRAELEVWRNNQPVSDHKLNAWLSRDTRRLPLKIEAHLPFGVIRVELVRVHP